MTTRSFAATKILVDGTARGQILKLAEPISFWGGINPATAKVIDARHPDRGRSIKDRILCLPGMIGSSSASAVMLELLRAHIAPAALILGETDAILALGVVVGREMGYPTIPVLELPREMQALLPQDALAQIETGGRISLP